MQGNQIRFAASAAASGFSLLYACIGVGEFQWSIGLLGTLQGSIFGRGSLFFVGEKKFFFEKRVRAKLVRYGLLVCFLLKYGEFSVTGIV